MKIKFTLLLFFLFSGTLFTQTRYIDEVFDDIHIQEDVVYGNAPDLPFIFLFEWNTVDIDLDLDIYTPIGDTLTHRPVIIFAHTGAFFSGHNELDDVVDLATSAAKRGYVAISINYRLGLNIISTYSGERAVYRGVQDAGAAIRYLREFPEEFGINPDQIFMWGTSAGALIGLHLSYLDDEDRPIATYGGGSDPDLGCPICEGNDYAHDPKPNAIVSCWGAIGDLDWIDSDDTVPAILFHGTLDLIVPFNSGLPFTLNIALPIVYGSGLINDRLEELDIHHELHAEPGLLHEYWGTVNGNWFLGPNEYFYQIQSDAYSFLYNYLDCSQQNPLSLCLVAEGGLSEVLLDWEPNAFAESYNIYRDGEFVGNIPSDNSFYLDDGTFGDATGFGLSYDNEYCYTIATVEVNGNEDIISDEVCAYTLPQLQVFLDLDLSLANADVAVADSPFGDLTGDGNIDAVIMVKMVNFFPINGYQFNYTMNPGIVDILAPFDGTNIQFDICITQAMEAGMDGPTAAAYCESEGYSIGIQSLIGAPGNSGMVMGFDINGTGYIPAGFPGDGGNEGNLLTVLVLDSQYYGSGDEVTVTISDFIVSGINPLTGGMVTLSACDADLDPLNGCFDVDSFSTPVSDCFGIPGGPAVEDACGACDGDGLPCFASGDVNLDGELNILDVVILVNMILGIQNDSIYGDMNNDATINILDVVLLVNEILGVE